MELTRKEIIDKVANHYNLRNRGFDEETSSCVYLTKEGNYCAVGMFLKDRTEFLNCGDGVGSIDLAGNLVDEVKHLSGDINFWDDLQDFHDDEDNWNTVGISAEGLRTKKRLERIYVDD